ncbi:hypothetical protein PG994_006575 [Apiospora phragmitis]|uniref:Uncharacterized protein n=1 Tax=Apiospora phragmitis TaxID=2905665 RepID=A0ABR1VFE9_9PEZI
MSAKRCARLRPASKRRQPVPPKSEEDAEGDSSSSTLECYDFYACGDVFARGTYDELVTDASRPRFRGADRGDRRCADLCPLCWTEACWGERGLVRGVRMTVRAPLLRLRRQRLIRQGRASGDGASEEGLATPPKQTEDNTLKRRVRKEQELKKWRPRGLMKGHVQIVLDDEFRIQRADRRYRRDEDLYRDDDLY